MANLNVRIEGTREEMRQVLYEDGTDKLIDLGRGEFDPANERILAMYFLAEGGTAVLCGYFDKDASDKEIISYLASVVSIDLNETGVIAVRFGDDCSPEEADRLAFSEAWFNIAGCLCEDLVGHVYIAQSDKFAAHVEEVVEDFIDAELNDQAAA